MFLPRPSRVSGPNRHGRGPRAQREGSPHGPRGALEVRRFLGSAVVSVEGFAAVKKQVEHQFKATKCKEQNGVLHFLFWPNKWLASFWFRFTSKEGCQTSGLRGFNARNFAVNPELGLPEHRGPCTSLFGVTPFWPILGEVSFWDGG